MQSVEVADERAADLAGQSLFTQHGSASISGNSGSGNSGSGRAGSAPHAVASGAASSGMNPWRPPSGSTTAARAIDVGTGVTGETVDQQLAEARAKLAVLEKEVGILRSRSQRVDALLHSAPVAVLEMDEHGAVTFANPAALEALGILDSRALLGRVWVDCIAQEQRALAMQLVRRAVSGLAAIIEVDTIDSYEPRSLAMSLIPMGHRRVLCVAQDITARLRSERRQRELVQQMQLAQKVARIGSWRWDRRTDEVTISAEAQRLLRLRPTLTRLSLEDLFLAVLPEDPATAFLWASDTRAHGNLQARTVTIATPTGTRVLQLRGDVVTDEAGRVQGHVGTVQDISEQRAAESERRELLEQMLHVQKLESLGVLAGGIAHDFNNLLMGILGNASLALLDLPPGHPLEVPIGHIERAGTRAADLCRQLLAYAGRGTFVSEPVDLREVATEMVGLLRSSSWRHARVHLEIPDSLPKVQGDGTQLAQVMMNLLTNAAEALPPEGGRVDVSLSTRWLSENLPARASGADYQLPAGFYVCLEVRDEGSGMDEDTLARIFEPFFSTKFTGRGLGLSAVSGIVRSHHGSIEVRSELHVGTTIRICLPALEAMDEPKELRPREDGSDARDRRPLEFEEMRQWWSARLATCVDTDPDATVSDSGPEESPVEITWTDNDVEPAPPAENSIANLVRASKRRDTILLVDDDPTVSEVGSRMLSRLGFRVLKPRDGQDVLDFWRTTEAAEREGLGEKSQASGPNHGPTTSMTYIPIDAVILDLQAPSLSGTLTLARLRDAGIDVPVLFSTGDRGVSLPADLGPNVHRDILHKPYRLDQLSRSLREVLTPLEGE